MHFKGSHKAGLSLEAGSGANPVAVRPFCAGYLVSGDQRQNISLFLNDNNFNVWTNKVAQISPRMLEISSQWFSNFKVLQGAWPGTRVAIRHASYASIIQFSRLLNSYQTFITFSNDNPEIFLHQGFLNDQMHVFVVFVFFLICSFNRLYEKNKTYCTLNLMGMALEKQESHLNQLV